MGMTDADISALVLTLKLAGLTTFILLLISMPMAWWLAHTRMRFRFVVEAVIALPLALPPTVLGFYLLVAMGPEGIVGALGGQTLAFSFTGLLIGSVVYSLPFVLQPIYSSFKSIDARYLDAAATLGARPLDRFVSVVVPLARPGIITGAVLGFAHTLGEFGVVLMIGGNIPGETRVLSIAIYEHVEALDFSKAHVLSALMLGLSLVLLLTVYAINQRRDAA
jgi:molybdate transport system permease protein